MAEEPEARLRIGISSCLLGNEVRYNGGHKRDRYLTGTLGQYFEYVPVCPEVEVGLGVPRPTLRLVGDPDAPRMVVPSDGRDLTEDMSGFSATRVEELRAEGLDGFILKKGSPSCGLFRVKVYNDKGMPDPTGSGLFAAALRAAFPLLPLEEEGRLHDPLLREAFIVRVYCHARWRKLREAPSRRALSDFHGRHKFLLMVRDEVVMRELGRLVADASQHALEDVLDRYAVRFFEALCRVGTRKRHTNVLQHLAGFFKKSLDDFDREQLHASIESYRTGLVPLIVPITLMRYFQKKVGGSYLSEQIYLEPHPREMMLLNTV